MLNKSNCWTFYLYYFFIKTGIWKISNYIPRYNTYMHPEQFFQGNEVSEFVFKINVKMKLNFIILFQLYEKILFPHYTHSFYHWLISRLISCNYKIGMRWIFICSEIFFLAKIALHVPYTECLRRNSKYFGGRYWLVFLNRPVYISEGTADCEYYANLK